MEQKHEILSNRFFTANTVGVSGGESWENIL
jgi:hypothetical protein